MENNTFKELVNYAKDQIDSISDGHYGCDLHNEIFNTDYFIIGSWKAKKWLKNNGGEFNAIHEIQDYENSNFGQINTDLSDAEKVVNMYVYILGEEILSKSKILQDNWDNRLTEEDMQEIVKELEELL